jgi:hypothetical protein
MPIRYSLWSFGLLFPFWHAWSKKNLAFGLIFPQEKSGSRAAETVLKMDS